MGKRITCYEIKSVEASKAQYQEGRGRLPKIELNFETYNGERLQLSLFIEDAAKLINQMTAAYDAAIPQIQGRAKATY